MAAVQILFHNHNELIIRDVHEKWHEKVKNFMLENYFKPHRLFHQIGFHDDPAVSTEYLKYVDHILKDECSLVAVHNQTEEIYAVALVKCMTKEWRSWAAFELCVDQSTFSDYIELQYRMINQYANENPDNPYDSLHLFEYYVGDELRYDTEFMRKFFDAIYQTAHLMKMPRVSFLALSADEEDEGFDQDYTMLTYIIYSVFVLHGRSPFAKLRDIEEMQAVLFQKEVEPLMPYYFMIVRGIDDVVVEQPVENTRKSSVHKTAPADK